MSTTMGATENFARWIAATTCDEFPATAIERAKKSILDFIGTATYGATTQLDGISMRS